MKAFGFACEEAIKAYALIVRHGTSCKQIGQMSHRRERRSELVRNRRDEVGLLFGEFQLTDRRSV
jgi:hypothetical protein